ncbi:hypothetical protein EST62_07035 [Chlorobaculum sp. 24CR]|uniref:hypothetical protein n=1 Tax=Chlorobaculum sp. 24CR TaxID=2508878 RepID=UPI00100B4F95|nr:hypothetical protein [Chlorobaculum sp. 24CR]RXK87516.1 hypothetical protein EST62_07035 [Chlorobaculum sp. 24CR]
MNDEKRNALETHYRPVVEEVVERWAVGKPPNPSPAATSYKPSGYFRLTNYLLDYAIRHRALPSGLHRMPEGRDRFGNFEPGFVVNFDQIVGDSSLREP